MPAPLGSLTFRRNTLRAVLRRDGDRYRWSVVDDATGKRVSGGICPTIFDALVRAETALGLIKRGESTIPDVTA